jgi:hypothetical protein
MVRRLECRGQAIQIQSTPRDNISRCFLISWAVKSSLYLGQPG